MLIPKKHRQAIYEALFRDGVMVAKKDFNAEKHMEVDTHNLYVIKALQVLSLCRALSHALVSEVARVRHGEVRVAALLLVSDG